MLQPFIARRRVLLGGLAAALGNSTLVSRATCQPRQLAPNPATFETGDFLWPKPMDAYIPYASDGSIDNERTQWEAERVRYSRYLFSKGRLSSEESELLRSLSSMSFEAFYARYVENQPEGRNYQPYGTVAGVGHVAVLKLEASRPPVIIEAMPNYGVRRMTYSEWSRSREGQEIYHGRLSQAPPSERAGIAEQAEGFIGKPYNFVIAHPSASV